MNLLIKFPSRERMAPFFHALNAAQHNRKLSSTRFLVTLDEDDPTMNSDRAKNSLAMWGNVTTVFGKSKNKVEAVNRDMEQAGEWDIVLLLSDDMIVQKKGFDELIVSEFEKHFPDTDGVLWMNDGYTGQKLNTIACMGKAFYNRFGYIYNPAFKSLFCDNELTDVSIWLDKYHYIDEVIIRHSHPMNDRARRTDKLYARNDSFYNIDQDTFYRRKNKRFDLPALTLQHA